MSQSETGERPWEVIRAQWDPSSRNGKPPAQVQESILRFVFLQFVLSVGCISAGEGAGMHQASSGFDNCH